jgi:DNA-binding CsgD family transcriptional regulator
VELLTALDTARQIGLDALTERCEQALATLHDSARSAGPHPLTPRELDVLRLVAEGRSNREIGERLHTSRHTVANQIHSILTKTGSSNRIEAVSWATRRCLLDHD